MCTKERRNVLLTVANNRLASPLPPVYKRVCPSVSKSVTLLSERHPGSRIVFRVSELVDGDNCLLDVSCWLFGCCSTWMFSIVLSLACKYCHCWLLLYVHAAVTPSVGAAVVHIPDCRRLETQGRWRWLLERAQNA